ncbi:MAG TPA: 4Fe-4S binding protein [Candidatus Brocadiia bacterium]|nr:4Fe-4S binding protein [Candidatus Brocadiia bacterium]
MAKTKLVLSFPPSLINEPITWKLVKTYDLKFNILRASIHPDDAGQVVIELEGSRQAIEDGRAYLEECGVRTEALSQDVTWSAERCVQCSACVSICPTGALSVERPSMKVTFDKEKCIGCELCIPVCPYRAMEIHV